MKIFILLLFDLKLYFMKKDVIKTIINVALAMLTALATALGVNM